MQHLNGPCRNRERIMHLGERSSQISSLFVLAVIMSYPEKGQRRKGDPVQLIS